MTCRVLSCRVRADPSRRSYVHVRSLRGVQGVCFGDDQERGCLHGRHAPGQKPLICSMHGLSLFLWSYVFHVFLVLLGLPIYFSLSLDVSCYCCSSLLLLFVSRKPFASVSLVFFLFLPTSLFLASFGFVCYLSRSLSSLRLAFLSCVPFCVHALNVLVCPSLPAPFYRWVTEGDS